MTEEVRYEILNWLEEIRVLPPNSGLNAVIEQAATGVALARTINFYEGKDETIKGVTDIPKKKSQKHSNVQRSLEFLRKFPKMNMRRLWDTEKVLKKEEEAIWELLLDMFNYYKIVRASKSKSTLNMTTTMFKKGPKITFNPEEKIFSERTMSPSNLNSGFDGKSFLLNYSANVSKILTDNNASLEEINRNILMNTLEMDPKRSRKRRVYQPELSISESATVTKKPEKKRFITFDGNVKQLRETISRTGSKENLVERTEDSVSRDEKSVSFLRANSKKGLTVPKRAVERDLTEEIKEWLVKIGIDNVECINFNEKVLEPFKDGVLLCEIISTLTREKLNVTQFPRSRTGAMFNINKALTRLSQLKLPIEVLRCRDEIFSGERRSILRLLSAMKKKFYAQTEIILKSMKNYKRGLTARGLKTKGKTRLSVVTSNLKDNSRALNSSLSKEKRRYLLATPKQFWS